MEYGEYLKLMEDVQPSEKMEYERAVLWLHPQKLPLGLVSLGGEQSSVIRVPAKAKNLYGRIVPVIAIARKCFAGNERITDVILPSGISSLPAGAFAGCSSLRNITIPRRIKTIKENTFAGCVSLQNIFYEGTIEEWRSVEIVCEKRETRFGPLIPGTPVQSIVSDKLIHLPGNDALLCADIHFRCALESADKTSFYINTTDGQDITELFRNVCLQ